MATRLMFRTWGPVARISTATPILRFNIPLKASVACICGKDLRDPTAKRPAPYPYKTKKFGFFQQFYDIATKRFDENTKIIVVDGNIASGKTTLAKQLAEEFDMLYIPEPTMDRKYITSYGYDLRLLDPIVPEIYKSCDLKTFYQNPHGSNVPFFQLYMFIYRYEDYIDALAHLLNSGQGIVMDRSVYSDVVFAKAMHDAGYLGKEYMELYDDRYYYCVKELLRPHLFIYLDVPVDVLQERIKKRNNPFEVGSKVLTNDYLQSIADHYTHELLPELERRSEVLIYDWSQFGDLDVVVDDIEHIDFDKYGTYDLKLRDWLVYDHWDWSHLRFKYTNDKEALLIKTLIFRLSVPELFRPLADVKKYEEILKKVPGMKYAPGFNPDMGDKVLFRDNAPYMLCSTKYALT